MKRLNPNNEPLTPEKLRELSGLDLSDEEAQKIIWSIKRFARVLYGFATQQQVVNNENKEKE
ncbi:hypothetical protein GO495_06015 [Chitinophaga oryziterrae]|uniref:Uncharacterized protein n=1 Tax=Chitinophaga oryziterrae TaxID=1031224 RepID=A0A6N8J4N2_9BACT|nr:hypothetical protein [Chitinophaga oryziterrae]MVT40130.1 hypothetical protein [Chitinophaga oryziterrae]